MMSSIFRSFLLASAALASLAVGVSADELAGPGRISVVNESWGSIFYVPGELHDYEYRRSDDSRTMQSRLGKVTIKESGLGSYEVTFPHGKLVVEGTSSEAKVSFLNKKYEFKRAGRTFTVATPDENIHYDFQPNLMTCTGKGGTTKIVQTNGDYKVESPEGSYSYTPTPDGGFVVRGGPLARHPYIYRGVIFQDAGVGVFIDFKKLDPESPLFRFVEWTPMMQFHAVQSSQVK